MPPITCRASAADAAVGLRSADFLGAYQSAVDAAGSADLTIRFLSVPQSGDLYWDWSLDQNGRVSGVRLTEANLDGFLFTAGGSAGKRIDEVAYVRTARAGKTRSATSAMRTARRGLPASSTSTGPPPGA